MRDLLNRFDSGEIEPERRFVVIALSGLLGVALAISLIVVLAYVV